LTEKAARHISGFIAKRGKGVGLRLGVRTSGCSGMACKLEFADGVNPDDTLPSASGWRRACSSGQVVAARARPVWARLIHKVYEVDPLACPKCGAPMHVIALIDDAIVIRRILEHLGRWAPRQARKNQRAPPADAKGIDELKPPVREWTYHPVPDIT
jgi:hypothetical protein